MKAVLFDKPLEYNLHIEGESWKQGEKIKGNIKVKNHINDKLTLQNFNAFLAIGDIKKIKNKDNKGYKIINIIDYNPTINLDPTSETSLDFEFQLETNCEITQKNSSLYIICGSKENLANSIQLQLNILPIDTISSYFEILENFYRFKVKSLKNKKDYIEATIQTPNTKELGGVQKCSLLIKVNNKNLELVYQYKLKKLSYENGSVETKDINLDIDQILEPKQYEMYGAPNQDGIRKSIDEMILKVKQNGIF